MGFGPAHTNLASQAIPAFENLPARLSVDVTALVLGFQSHDVPVLVSEKLLIPLGAPAPNAPKFFAKVHISQCAGDPRWLHKATIAVSRYWKRKRSGPTKAQPMPQEQGSALDR
jgi:hypothetical protein